MTTENEGMKLEDISENFQIFLGKNFFPILDENDFVFQNGKFCKHDHPLTTDTIKVLGNGRVTCRWCWNADARRHRLMREGPAQLSVYFISDGTGHIKIGRTKLDTAIRLRHIQIGNPTELRLEAVETGGPTLELDLQEQFAGARIRGEWFRFTPEIAMHIDDLRVSG